MIPRLALRFLLISSLALAALRAEVRLPVIFGDHMVLQRERPVAVWGEASPGEKVTVEFGGQTKSTSASPEGKWSLALDAMPASAESRNLVVKGNNTLSLSDVLVGEVWLCSGQSNMEKPIGQQRGQQPTTHAEEEIKNANHPTLRLFQMPRMGKLKEGDLGLCWVACTPESVDKSHFSAAGYFFGRELIRELGVPVGMIHSSFGGTRIEVWTSLEALSSDPRLADYAAASKSGTKIEGLIPSSHYKAMIAPLVPYSLRGFLWYQGESNSIALDADIYDLKVKVLVDSWRKVWNDPKAPFFSVHLAPYTYSKRNTAPRWFTSEALPLTWDAQVRALSIPNTGMICTNDLVHNINDIHPIDKLNVGVRLAKLALAKTYGKTSVLCDSPLYGSQKIKGSTVEINFAQGATGLKSSNGMPLNCFTVAGSDQVFHPAEAIIRDDKIVVSSSTVRKPMAVRFAWHESQIHNLVNAAGLPAYPFRTDSWTVKADRPATAQELELLEKAKAAKAGTPGSAPAHAPAPAPSAPQPVGK